MDELKENKDKKSSLHKHKQSSRDREKKKHHKHDDDEKSSLVTLSPDLTRKRLRDKKDEEDSSQDNDSSSHLKSDAEKDTQQSQHLQQMEIYSPSLLCSKTDIESGDLTKQIHVGNLPFTFSFEEVFDYLKRYGKIMFPSFSLSLKKYCITFFIFHLYLGECIFLVVTMGDW